MTEKVLRRAYSPSYFSLDYILACQTLVPCRTEINLPKFGFLVPDCQSQDLPRGVSFQLPLWAARVMCKPGRTHVSVDIPPGFKESYSIEMVDLEGKKMTSDLRKVNRQYFEVGHLSTALYNQDVSDLAEILPEVFQQRLLQIGSATLPGYSQPWIQNQFVNAPIPPDYMDLLELQISEEATQASNRILEWLEPVIGPPPVSNATLLNADFQDKVKVDDNQLTAVHG